MHGPAALLALVIQKLGPMEPHLYEINEQDLMSLDLWKQLAQYAVGCIECEGASELGDRHSTCTGKACSAAWWRGMHCHMMQCWSTVMSGIPVPLSSLQTLTLLLQPQHRPAQSQWYNLYSLKTVMVPVSCLEECPIASSTSGTCRCCLEGHASAHIAGHVELHAGEDRVTALELHSNQVFRLDASSAS